MANVREMIFDAADREAAIAWQRGCRDKLFQLMMGGARPEMPEARAEVVQHIDMPYANYSLEEITIQTLPDRRAHCWMAIPREPSGKVGGVLAIHGHAGSGEQVLRGEGLYWYGRHIAEMGYVVIAPDVGSHDLQHPDWTLMGERTWDCLCALDYLARRPDVDAGRLAVVGLSLGGETTMYVAALDERLKLVDSSGWLTTVENMRNGHCPCYDFPGLEEHFDFADVFSLIAPRTLICEIGRLERAGGGFPVEVAFKAMAEIKRAYGVFGAGDSAQLDVHPGGHMFSGRLFFPLLFDVLGKPV